MAAAKTDYYALLEVSPDADLATLRASHKRLLKKYHPDLNPHVDPRKVALINAAYEVLSDPTARADYDRRHKAREQLPHNAPAQRAQWPAGFDPFERARHEARTDARYQRAQEARRQAAAAEEAARKTEEAARAAERKRDREVAAANLAQHRERLKARREDYAATEDRKRRAASAKEIAAQVSRERYGRLTQREKPVRRSEATQHLPLDRFRAIAWKALEDPDLRKTRRRIAERSQGTWELMPHGIRWKTLHGSATFIPASEIDWAVKRLFLDGELPRMTLAGRLSDPDRLGDQGWPVARALFALLSRLPFFVVTEQPLTLHFERLYWEPLLVEE